MTMRASVIAAAAALLCLPAMASHAQGFRAGSDAAGGRIGALCNVKELTPAEQNDCTERMRATDDKDERAAIRAEIKAKVSAVRKQR